MNFIKVLVEGVIRDSKLIKALTKRLESVELNTRMVIDKVDLVFDEVGALKDAILHATHAVQAQTKVLIRHEELIQQHAENIRNLAIIVLENKNSERQQSSLGVSFDLPKSNEGSNEPN